MEGHAYTLGATYKTEDYEGILLKSVEEIKKMWDHPDTPDYFSQWQLMPVDPQKWQLSKRQIEHPGRVQVAKMVKVAGDSVLDVGCGIGLDYEHYRDSKVRYLGVDVTPKFVNAALERGVPAQLGNVLALPFKDGVFDTVYCKDLLIHLPPDDWKRALKEMVRVARVQVVTLEDNWIEGDTEYIISERQVAADYVRCKSVQLEFFHNAYCTNEFLEYASTLDVDVKVVHVELPNPLVVMRGIIRTAQITVYSKRGV